MVSRGWCFTLYDYADNDIEKLLNMPVRYVIIGKEKCPTTGRAHLQGFVEIGRPQRMSWVKTQCGRNDIHLEPSRSKNRDAAREYCKKEGDWIERGDWASGGQGQRTDLQDIIEMIKENKPQLEILTSFPEPCARHLKFVDRVTELVEKEQTREFRNVTVDVFWGDSGSGKTRKAHEENPGIFTVNAGESFPFEGYQGEEAILIDDFYGGIKYHEMLRILDGHQYRVNVKGSHRYARWTKVIITSNDEPKKWYSRGLTPALERRISRVTKFCNEVAGNTMPPLEECDYGELFDF